MKRRLLTNQELKMYKYPNLMAEVMETTYSICTIADSMGLPKPYRKEDDAETWDKLTGKTEMSISEAVGLSRLFGVKIEYLIKGELETFDGKSAAYWRWINRKRKIKEEYEFRQELEKIVKQVQEKPFLLDVLKDALAREQG